MSTTSFKSAIALVLSFLSMPFLFDIYALAPERTDPAIKQFLSHFVPSRERAADEYQVPEYSDSPTSVFDSPEKLILHCCQNPEAESRAYWRNLAANEPRHAHIFFLPDGGLVFGLSIATEDEIIANRWLSELLSFTGATYGYCTGECPPENSISEFIALAIECGSSRSNPKS